MDKMTIREQIGTMLMNMGVDHRTKTYGEMADELIKNGVTIRQWISAHEYCPIPNQTTFYLVKNNNGEARTAKLDYLDWKINSKIGWIDANGNHLNASNGWIVEYWSPLDNNIDNVKQWPVHNPNRMTSVGVKSIWKQNTETGKYYCDNCRVAQHTSMVSTCPDCGATMTNYAAGMAI